MLFGSGKAQALNKRSKHELEFLPAALEIQETPPSPIGRAIAWSLMLFFTIAVLWALIGKVDVVATAQGKIIPSGRVKLIQPLEIGVIRAIHVNENQSVEQGALLVELDPTSSGADKKQLSEQMMLTQIEIARLQIFMTILSGEKSSNLEGVFTALPDADPNVVNLQQQILQNQVGERTARLAALSSDIARQQANLDAIQATVTKLEGTLPLVTQRAEAMRTMVERKFVTQTSYLEMEQLRIEQQQDLATQRNRSKEAKAAIVQAEQQRETAEAEYRRNALADLAEAEKRLITLRQELVKTEQRQHLEHLTAPINGVVQQLAVHTVGGVVTPAQVLMVIVPLENKLEVEAFIENKDIGFVHNNQQAEVKIETFPFTKYGTIDAEIINLSNDAISDEKRGLIYAARVLLKRSTIQVEDKLVNLTPGMAVTVEIKTGKRRLIEYFLSPLLRYKQESIRER